MSFFYPKLSCVLAVLLALLPLIFHTWFLQATPSPLPPRPPSVPVGPLPEADWIKAEGEARLRNPLDTPGTLAMALYQWVSDLVTEFIIITPEFTSEQPTHWCRIVSL